MAARKLLTVALALALAAGVVRADPVSAARVTPPLARLSEEVEIAALMSRLRDEAPFGKLEIDNVQVVDPSTASVTPRQSVLVLGSRIFWVGEVGHAPKVDGVTVIDGRGRFLSPGLSDMHVHTSRADAWLLDLAVGVTTVRDMDGFPWMLAARDRINAGRMLGPVDYVAGTIIAGAPLDDYAVVVTNPEDGRRLVRQQAGCGYDFIKVHNILRQPVFDAVADQAQRLGLDLVGHVPHDISLYHALHMGRMRTTEHLKGFLVDATLEPSDEDYATALAGIETWITPTLFTQRSYDRGDWAQGVLAGATARYVPPDVRRGWATLLAHPDARDLKSGALLQATESTVMARLIPLKPHWLTGTDAEDYPFNVMGYALLGELQMLEEAGLTPTEVLRASTLEAAAALRQPEEFGLVAKGFRADLVLLDRNPLQDGSAFKTNAGVMAHGRWLNRTALDRALTRLAAIYADDSHTPALTRANMKALLSRLAAAQVDGFVFDDAELAVLAGAARKAGLVDLGTAAEALEITPKSGPCAVALPID